MRSSYEIALGQLFREAMSRASDREVGRVALTTRGHRRRTMQICSQEIASFVKRRITANFLPFSSYSHAKTLPSASLDQPPFFVRLSYSCVRTMHQEFPNAFRPSRVRSRARRINIRSRATFNVRGSHRRRGKVTRLSYVARLCPSVALRTLGDV